RGSRDTIAQAVSGSDGGYRVPNVPVGDYVAIVDTASVGDSAEVVRLDSGSFTLRPADSVTITVGVSYPTVSIAQLRALPGGVRVFVSGRAANEPTAFGDSIVHLLDVTGAIRATRVPAGLLLIGDSVRMSGARGARDGQPTLDNVTVFPLPLPQGALVPELVTTAAADTADGGRLDAALARVADALILDSTTVDTPGLPGDGDYIITVDDGTGQLVVVFDGDAPLNVADYVPGARIFASGVLVPTGAGRWRLKPRVNLDVACPTC
ncbi:MAG: OB-fold nucleic acid binding domain-containing protein, partial [Actinomycetota bacterium]